jgi:SagB-type dehydrogenase family enzyme
LRAPKPKRVRRAAPAKVFVRLRSSVTLDAHANGEIIAHFNGYSVGVGAFGAGAADCLRGLRIGLPLGSLESDGARISTETDVLVRRLAGHGLLEYRLARSREGDDLVIIEPQVSNYWPRTPTIEPADRLVLSRFAYLRRRGQALVLESPRAGALFKICDPQLATLIAALSTPKQVKQLRRQAAFPGIAFLGLLVDCEVIVKGDAGGNIRGGDHNLALWEFHDLLFHARSTEGRHANALGGTYPHAGVIAPLPAVRPAWPGKQIDLSKFAAARPEAISPVATLLRQRRSTRSFDDRRPITLAELSQFLDRTARVLSRSNGNADLGDGGHVLKPYPSAGASYEIELYLAINICDGLGRGLYHYDGAAHALVRIDVAANAFDTLMARAIQAMGAPGAPQILITIAARFGRISWKYSSIAYALILKDVGVLTQTFYLAATDMGLGGCAIGIVNIDLFAKMTGIEFHIEGPVGQFAIGRPAEPGPPEDGSR